MNPSPIVPLEGSFHIKVEVTDSPTWTCGVTEIFETVRFPTVTDDVGITSTTAIAGSVEASVYALPNALGGDGWQT